MLVTQGTGTAMPVLELLKALAATEGAEAVCAARPLHAAATMPGGEVLVDSLLADVSLELDVNSCDDNGRTPLHVAVHAGHSDVVEALLQVIAAWPVCGPLVRWIVGPLDLKR